MPGAELLYFVGQYVSGGDLARRLQEAPNQRLPIADVLRLADELCQALEHAHAHGVLHRDIKPSNVYLAADGSALLGDFGVAVSLDRTRITPDGMIVGTVAYMPPEQALGRTPDPRGDLYGLGVLLYQAVAGRPPFLGDDAVAVISQHINTAPVAPSWHEPKLPAELEALILALLAKDPEGRPESAARVREILREIAEAPMQTAAVETRLNPLDRLAGGTFVGRERELMQLRADLDSALSGHARIPMLVGEPGIGKTRTAEEVATYARMRGAKVLWGRCYEGTGAPYWPWVQILRALVRECDRETLQSEMASAAADIGAVVSEVRERLPDLPDPPAADPDEARLRLFEGITGFLRNASSRQPLAIVIDDLHWADRASLRLLEFLAAELGRARVLVIGTYRDVELPQQHPLATTLAELTRSQHSERIQLRGLSREDVARFLERTSHAEPPAALVEAVWRATAGNPFFLHETVRLLAADGRFERAAEIDATNLEIPPGVREVVARRLGRLSEACNEALRVAAVLGRDFEARVLARVAALPDDTLLEALEEALGARLIEDADEIGGRYRFAHALVQQTLYEESHTPRRARLHRRAGEVLEEVHTRPGLHLAEIAHHFFQALHDVGGAERSVDASVRAGEWARAQLAYEDAARHYGRAVEALELVDEPDEMRLCELLLEYGLLSELAGDRPATIEISQRAVELARRLDASELFARAVLLYTIRGNLGRIGWGRVEELPAALLEEGLERIGPEDSPLRARLLHSLGFHVRAGRHRRQAREIATRLNDASLLFAVSSSVFDDAVDEWLPLAEERARLAPGVGKGAEFEALLTRAAVRFFVGDVAGAWADLESVERIGKELRDWRSRYGPAVHRAMRAIFVGQLGDGERLAVEAHQLGRGSAGLEDLWFMSQLFVIWLHRGTLCCNPAIEAFAGQTNDFSSCAMLARMYVEEDAREDAARWFELVASKDFEASYRTYSRFFSLCLFADVCVYLEDKPRAARLYEEMRPYAQYHALHADVPVVHMGPLGMRVGMLETLLGRFSEAEEHLRAAIAWTEGAGARPWLAHTRIAYARMLLARADPRDREHALEQASAALELAREIGMQGVLQDALALKLDAQGRDGKELTLSIEGVIGRLRAQRPDLARYCAPDGSVTLMLGRAQDSSVIPAVLRAKGAAHGGHEVELREDGFLFAFPDASRAAQCAVALQHKMASTHLRIGLHTGEYAKDTGKFFGRSVAQALRIWNLARDGEILMSSPTRELIPDEGILRLEEKHMIVLEGVPLAAHHVFAATWE